MRGWRVADAARNSRLPDTPTMIQPVEKPAPAKLEGHTALLSEHRYGTYARTLNFRDPVDADGSEAKLEHGVLTISVPKVREAQPRKIEIKLG